MAGSDLLYTFTYILILTALDNEISKLEEFGTLGGFFSVG